MAESIRFEYAVYLLGGQKSDPQVALQAALKAKLANLKLVDELPGEPRGQFVRARLEKDVPNKYAAPDVEALKYFGEGLTDQQAQKLQQCREAFILEFAYPKQFAWTGLKQANELIEEVARKTSGLIWDEETREVFSPEAWHKKRIEPLAASSPDAPSQTVIHVYSNGQYARAITLGMSKMGLPDVVIQELPWSSENQVGHLLNLFAQSLAEGISIRNPGKFKLDLKTVNNANVREDNGGSLGHNALAVACFTLKQGRWEEGDPKNRLIELSADAYPGNDNYSRQERMISSFFGSEDAITMVHDNKELLAASAKAREQLPALRRDFEIGLKPGEFIEVKAPFKTTKGGREWMWVEVTSWSSGRIKGSLENQPYDVPSLRAGQAVEVQEADVFDYIRTYPDKHTEGNTTAQIIAKMSESKNKMETKPVIPDCEN